MKEQSAKITFDSVANIFNAQRIFSCASIVTKNNLAHKKIWAAIWQQKSSNKKSDNKNLATKIWQQKSDIKNLVHKNLPWCPRVAPWPRAPPLGRPASGRASPRARRRAQCDRTAARAPSWIDVDVVNAAGAGAGAGAVVVGMKGRRHTRHHRSHCCHSNALDSYRQTGRPHRRPHRRDPHCRAPTKRTRGCRRRARPLIDQCQTKWKQQAYKMRV